VASGRSDAILRAIPNKVVITDIALSELERGRARGRRTIEGVERLIGNSLVSVVSCPEDAEAIFFELVGGNAAETLDDGEASTLAYALTCSGCAVIDEKKATAIAGRRFPSLPLLSTTDLLLSSELQAAIGDEAAVATLYEALTGARMRVPDRLIELVCKRLGGERAGKCHSLPRRSRPVPIEPAETS
jgi:hypothetical protein